MANKGEPLIPDRLVRVLDDRGLARVGLARLIGVHENSIANYIYGRSRPHPLILAAMADALGVSTGYLTGETDDPS